MVHKQDSEYKIIILEHLVSVILTDDWHCCDVANTELFWFDILVFNQLSLKMLMRKKRNDLLRP